MSLVLHYNMDNQCGGVNGVTGCDCQQLEQSDCSPDLQAHLQDVPSDLALHHYYRNNSTYTSLQDVINSRRPSVVDQPLVELENDTQPPAAEFNNLPSRPPSVLGELMVDSPMLDDGEETLKVEFMQAMEDRRESSANTSSTSPTALASNKLLDNGKFSDDLERTYSSPAELQGQFTTSQPDLQIPPGPQLQPVPHTHLEPTEPPHLVLDAPTRPPLLGKHHKRARTFPLRARPISQLAETGKHQHTKSSLVRPATPSKEETPVRPGQPVQPAPLQRSSSRRFTGFHNLPPPDPANAPPSPLHLQPYIGRARPLPPALPRPQFAPNPGPLVVPLPRRPSNSPLPVDPKQDAFYHELKGKLWKLAQELELRQPQRVTIPEGCEMPSPEPSSDDDLDPAFDDDSEDDDEDYQVFIAHNAPMSSKLDVSPVRRPSEGKGRQMARKRAETARLNWLRGPD